MLAIALLRTNRDRHALLIFIPMLVLGLLWPPVAKRVGFPSASLDQFNLLFESLVVAIALLWLNADKLGRYHGLMRVSMSLGIIMLAGFVAVISAGRTLSDPISTLILLFIAAMGIVLLVALAVTHRVTHGHYVPLWFTLWLAVWSLLFSTVGTVFFVMVRLLLASYQWPILIQAVKAGLALGLCLYAMNLPYLLLMFTSPFFRRRFHIWLGAAES
jgi:hypothetical protein